MTTTLHIDFCIRHGKQVSSAHFHHMDLKPFRQTCFTVGRSQMYIPPTFFNSERYILIQNEIYAVFSRNRCLILIFNTCNREGATPIQNQIDAKTKQKVQNKTKSSPNQNTNSNVYPPTFLKPKQDQFRIKLDPNMCPFSDKGCLEQSLRILSVN